MKTFMNFFTGTTGVIMAVMICGILAVVATIIFCVLSGAAITIIAGTPTP